MFELTELGDSAVQAFEHRQYTEQELFEIFGQWDGEGKPRKRLLDMIMDEYMYVVNWKKEHNERGAVDSDTLFQNIFLELEEWLSQEYDMRFWDSPNMMDEDTKYENMGYEINDNCWWSSWSAHEDFSLIFEQLGISSYGTNEWVLYQGEEWACTNPAQQDLGLDDVYEKTW